MTKKELALKSVEALKEKYPEAICSLVASNPFELLVATRLSAQCTDARVNIVTPPMFAKYKTLEDYANADVKDIEDFVRPCGFFRTKASDIVGMAQKILSDFDGKVPDNIEDLTSLPGVGRKTANLLLGDLYAVPGSVVCDTHCIRISGKLGLSIGKEPEKVEKQLRAILPPEESSDYCHRIVLFGREICTARNPKCDQCPLADLCETKR